MLLLSSFVDESLIVEGLVSIFIFNLLAYSDIMTGRIPVFLLFLSMVFGGFFGILDEDIVVQILGGIFNLILGIFIYWAGEHYVHPTNKETENAFGFGDIYGAGILGFLFGFPFGALGFMLTLILTILNGVIISFSQKKNFLGLRLKIGPVFYLAWCFMISFGWFGLIH